MRLKPLVMAIITAHLPTLANSQSSDYGPWQSTDIEGVRYREKYASTCGSGTSARYHYHEFENRGPYRVSFLASLGYIDADGRQRTSETSENLDSGRSSFRAGSWVCAQVGSVRLASVVLDGKPNARREPATGPGYLGPDGTFRAYGEVSAARPTLRNVRLDAGCRDLLETHSGKLELAGAAQKLIAWSPLLSLFPGPRVSKKNAYPASVAESANTVYSIVSTDWERLATSIVSVNKATLLILADDADLHSLSHSGQEQQFWQQLGREYRKRAQ